MYSLKELYRIGHGPSSSHTMGPRNAATQFLARNVESPRFEVTLYGSLAATGKGHMTDQAILEVLGNERTTIIWEPKEFLPFHPNGMKFCALDTTGKCTDKWTVYSVGGGALAEEGQAPVEHKQVYEMNTATDILSWCISTGKSYWEYVEECEGPEIWDYLREVWYTMKNAVQHGLEQEGVLPGPLALRRKAANYYVKAEGYQQSMRTRGFLFAYALAVSEENAAGGKIVTAPTCGSCGVLPAVLYHLYKSRDFSEQRIIRALATAGLFGNIVKTNASISGAEVGCQGEVGVACAMAAAAAAQLFGGMPSQIEYAAEMGLEHHLGLTCDPVCGLVQIPCIERNAYAAARAMDANSYAMFTDGVHRVSFDKVVEVMKKTGHDLPSLYKETAEGGLAQDYKQMWGNEHSSMYL
ncbi:MAG: L-serine ammonia-lyase [Bacteroidaceae bacterium]|nr:L-serine ammonia-lyase [Bacteroidaceae bacterium]